MLSSATAKRLRGRGHFGLRSQATKRLIAQRLQVDPKEYLLTGSELAHRQRHLDLKRRISDLHAEADNSMAVYLLAPEIESRVQRPDPVSEAERDRLVTATHTMTRDDPHPLMTGSFVRRRVWELLHHDLPAIEVVAWEELRADLSMRPLGRIELA